MERPLFTNKLQAAGCCILKSIMMVFVLAGLSAPAKLFAQMQTSSDSTKMHAPGWQQTTPAQYPKVVGYLSFILPVVTLQNGTTTANFSNGTSNIGFPVGVNVLYSDKFGFSYEFTPNIEVSGGTSKVNKILFDPGTMFRFNHGFTIISRLAFDTGGRYGFTPVFNQVYLRTKDVNYFVALSVPARFGNSEASSVGLNLQIGFIFN